jgi:hypothetical protein
VTYITARFYKFDIERKTFYASRILSKPLATQLAQASSDIRTLDELLRWGIAQRPELMISSVVIQDEYTHDVVLSNAAADIYLVFDCN